MPTRLRDLNDTDFGSLNTSKNKNIMQYNASTGKFNIIEIDSVLGFAASIPQSFASIVQDNLDTENIQISKVDGGLF